MNYYLQVSNIEGEVNEISEKIFNQKVEELRTQLNKKKP